MEVKINITPADLQAFQRFGMRRALSSSLTGSRLWIPLAVGFVFGFPIAIGWKLFELQLHMPTAIVVLLFISLFLWLYYRRLPAVTTDEKGCALGPKLVRLDETGVHQTDDRHTGSSRWSGVLDVRDDGGHVFLMIDRYAGYIVPKRSFETADAVTRFVAFARDRSSTPRQA